MKTELLFKYYSYDKYALSSLKNSKIWFSSPSLFNDPFDCNVEFGPDLLSNMESPLWHQKAVTKAFEGVYHLMANDIGVACFSDTPSEPLMWGHYAAEHRGFCVGYEKTADNVLSRGRPVYYSASQEKVPVHEILMDPMSICERLIYTKPTNWSYEREWRVYLRNAANSLVDISGNSISSVTFGYRMPWPHRRRIQRLLRHSKHIMYQHVILDREGMRLRIDDLKCASIPQYHQKRSARSESFNCGTYRDDLDELEEANWLRKLATGSEEPMIEATFKRRVDARSALLDLPYFYSNPDQEHFFCCRPIEYGLSQLSNLLFGVHLGGVDLRPRDLQFAEDVFVRRGGDVRFVSVGCRSDLSKKRREVARSAKKYASTGQVKFIKTERRSMGGVDFEFDVYAADSEREALLFLSRETVGESFRYIVVETPEGSFGKDIDGVYRET